MLAASYIVEFYDRAPWLTSFMTACCDIEFMAASYIVEFYYCVPGCRVSSRALCCRVSWPHAKNDESAGHVIKCRVCWPRAKNDESAGRALWYRVSWPRAKNVEPAGRVLTWFDLKIKKLILRRRLSLLSASYIVVLRPRAWMSSQLVTCCDVEWVDRMPKRVVILYISEMF